MPPSNNYNTSVMVVDGLVLRRSTTKSAQCAHGLELVFAHVVPSVLAANPATRRSTMIADTARELRAAAFAAGDASGYFPALYSRVTERIGASIEDGAFQDGPGLDRFATRFASHYIAAAHDHGRGPQCWQASWNVAADPRLLIVQHLLLGINAHVNYDLPRAVVEVADERGDLLSIRHDFDAVNDVLAATYVDVVKDLDRVSRWVNSAARLGGGHAFNFSLALARARAWQAATAMLNHCGPSALAPTSLRRSSLVTICIGSMTMVWRTA